VQWDVPAHADVIERIAVSTDGARVATASADGSAKLFDTVDGALLFTLPVGGGVFATAFSPDGQGLVTGGTDGTIRLWSVAGGTLVRRFTDSGGWILSLRYAGEGAAVISGGEFPSRIKEWNPMSGTPIQALTRLSAPIGKVTFSPDSALIAVAATFDERVDLYRASNGRRLYSWNLHSDVLDVAFSPDGRLVAMPGPGNTVVVRRLADGRVMHKLVGHQENVVGVAFSHDGTLLASGSFFPGSIRLWRTSDWTLVREIEGGSDLGAFGPFESFSFSPDDKLLGAVGEGSPIVVRVSDGSVVAAPASVTRAATFSPDGQLFVLSGGDNFDAVRIYRTSDWTLAHSLATGANDIAFSSDGKSLLVAHLDALRIWRTSDWTAVETYDRELGYTGDGQGVQAVAFAPDGSRLAYGRYDATLVTATNPRAAMPP
jgi:WD40 repeat protein